MFYMLWLKQLSIMSAFFVVWVNVNQNSKCKVSAKLQTLSNLSSNFITDIFCASSPPLAASFQKYQQRYRPGVTLHQLNRVAQQSGSGFCQGSAEQWDGSQLGFEDRKVRCWIPPCVLGPERSAPAAALLHACLSGAVDKSRTRSALKGRGRKGWNRMLPAL